MKQTLDLPEGKVVVTDVSTVWGDVYKFQTVEQRRIVETKLRKNGVKTRETNDPKGLKVDWGRARKKDTLNGVGAIATGAGIGIAAIPAWQAVFSGGLSVTALTAGINPVSVALIVLGIFLLSVSDNMDSKKESEKWLKQVLKK